MTVAKEGEHYLSSGESIEEGQVVSLNVREHCYDIVLPHVSTDYIQAKIAREGQPYELVMLEDMVHHVQKGDLVLDIGAHVGNHTLYLATIASCRVVAFEPNAALATALRHSVSRNRLDDFVEVKCLGLGKEDGYGRFARDIPNNLGSQNIEIGSGDICIRPLDGFAFERPVKLVKIDVEGMEIDVLRGAEELLCKDRPVVYVECLNEHDFRVVAEYFEQIQYGYWYTFNATPTHLFLPYESEHISERISRLRIKEAFDAYNIRDQLAEAREELKDANEKYRVITGQQVPALKVKMRELESQLSKGEEENHALRTKLDELSTQLSKKKGQDDEMQEMSQQVLAARIREKKLANELRAVRSSVSFQLGAALVSAVSSWHGLLGLPKSLVRICLQGVPFLFNQKVKSSFGAGRHQLVSKGSNFSFSLTSTDHTYKSSTETQRTRIKPAPAVLELKQGTSIAKLRVACIMDDFTFASFEPECCLHQLTPDNWRVDIELFQPELLFVESAWRGKEGRWDSKVGHRSAELQAIVDWCHERRIPTAFWNKEDPVHFETFLIAAKLFDYVFTTDIDCIHRYKAALGHERVYLLPFACQPALHNPIESHERKDAFCFAGAYYARYPERNRDLESLATELPRLLPLEIFDRNYGKDDPNYQFPEIYKPYIVGTLSFSDIDKAYKGYRYALNLNSIKESQTMFSRRVFELLASNTLTVSNYSRGLRLLFGDVVVSTDDGVEAVRRLEAIRSENGYEDRLRLAALRKVMLEHTYGARLAYVLSKVSACRMENALPTFKAIGQADSVDEMRQLIAHIERQDGVSASLTVVVRDDVRYLAAKECVELDVQRIRIATEAEFASATLAELAEDANWIVGIVSADHYGRNYLLDIALATRYTKVDVIGKETHYAMRNGEVILNRSDKAYQHSSALQARRSAITTEAARNIDAIKWLHGLEQWTYGLPNQFAIDLYNYCEEGAGSMSIEGVSCKVDDLPINIGLYMQRLMETAESIPPLVDRSTDVPTIHAEQLANHFGHPRRSRRLDTRLSDRGWEISSSLREGQHEYVYAPQKIPLEQIMATQSGEMEFRFYLESEPNLKINLVLIFFDVNELRITHTIKSSNRNQVVHFPPDATWIQLGLRIYGAGVARITRLLLDHRDLEPPHLISKSETLLVTNHYPAYGDLYRNGFVHSRVKAYQQRGVLVDVFRVQEGEVVAYHEFENVDIITGSQETLRRLLATRRYKSVLVHFLDPYMWEVLEDFVDMVKVVVWIHGAEIHPWYRRQCVVNNNEELEIAKLQSEKRLMFWRSLFMESPANLLFVFVSRTLAEDVMEDIGVRLPLSHYAIIHNPIDTDIFSYTPKQVEQRKKILSVRPYSSRIYANDLSVEAILRLKEETFFDELEFRLIGDGKLFDETVEPLQCLNNVRIEKRFLTHMEIAELHQEYGVFLCATRMDTQGVSRDEAMASGLVPVTNSVGAVPEFVDDKCGVLADPESVDGLAAGIKRLVESPNTFLWLSENAAKRVRQKSRKDFVIAEELDFVGIDAL